MHTRILLKPQTSRNSGSPSFRLVLSPSKMKLIEPIQVIPFAGSRLALAVALLEDL
jgi:hypothetical protein